LCLERTVEPHTGVVDEHVDPGPPGRQIAPEPRCGAGLREISGLELNADPMRRAELGRDLIQSVLAAPNQNQVKPIRCQ